MTRDLRVAGDPARSRRSRRARRSRAAAAPARRERRVSRNRIQKWIDAGDVLINGAAPPRAAWRVQAGDELRVRVAAIPQRARPQAEPLVTRRPLRRRRSARGQQAGRPGRASVVSATRPGTLMNGLLARARSWPAGSTPALLGRLDKLTSGIVLVTKRARDLCRVAARDGGEPHRQGLPRHRPRQAVAAARHDRSRARSRSVGSPPRHGDRSRRPAVGDAIRAAGDDERASRPSAAG